MKMLLISSQLDMEYNQEKGAVEQALHASRRNTAEMSSCNSGIRPQAVPRGITYARELPGHHTFKLATTS